MEDNYEMTQPIINESTPSESERKQGFVERLKTDKITLSVFIMTLILTVAFILIGAIVPLVGRYKTVSTNGTSKTVSVSYAKTVPNSITIPEKRTGNSYASSYEVLILKPKTFGHYLINAEETRGAPITIAVYRWLYGSTEGNVYCYNLTLVDASEEIQVGETAALEIDLYNDEYYICIFSSTAGESAKVWVNSLSRIVE